MVPRKEPHIFTAERPAAVAGDDHAFGRDRGKGIGLAAPQVSRSIRLFVTGLDDDKLRVFINPEIVLTSQEECDIEEGCLSIPDIQKEKERYYEIEYMTGGKKRSARGFKARIIQHEIDHMNGVLFLDREGL